MKNQSQSTVQICQIIGKVIAKPLQTVENEGYTEVQFYMELKNGKNVKVYMFGDVAVAGLYRIAEHQHLSVYGAWMASDAFRLTSFRTL